MANNFSISLPTVNVPTPPTAPASPFQTPAAQPVLFNQPAQTTMPTLDQFTSSAASLSQVAQPAIVGGVAGFKAPRGIENVRSKIGVNRYGQSTRSVSRSRSYSSRSYNSRSYSRSSGGARVGSSRLASFGLGAAIKSSVIFGGLTSLAINGYSWFNKRETGAQAGANVTGDLMSSAVGGAAGAVTSYVGAGMLASMGMGGGLLTIAGLGLGIAGYFVADKLLRQTNLFKSIQSGAYQLFGGH